MKMLNDFTPEFYLSFSIPKVSEEDIEEMFKFADKDRDGKISFIEFQTMIKPQKPVESNNNLALVPNSHKDGEIVKKVTIMTDEDLQENTDTTRDKDMLIAI